MITKTPSQKYKCIAFAPKFLTEGQSGRMQNQRFFHHELFSTIFLMLLFVCLRLQSLNSTSGSSDISPGHVPNMSVQILTQLQVRKNGY